MDESLRAIEYDTFLVVCDCDPTVGKAGRKSEVLGSIHAKPVGKVKRCASDSSSEGVRTGELFSALNTFGR